MRSINQPPTRPADELKVIAFPTVRACTCIDINGHWQQLPDRNIVKRVDASDATAFVATPSELTENTYVTGLNYPFCADAEKRSQLATRMQTEFNVSC